MPATVPAPIGYHDGSITTPRPVGAPRIRFPYKNWGGPPDTTAKVIERDYVVKPANYEICQRLGKYPYSNRLIHTDNLALWAYVISGTGVAPVLTPGFLGPTGLLDGWRLQLDRGAGGTTSDQSIFYDGVGSLANPHNHAQAFWLKSNTGIIQKVYYDDRSPSSSPRVLSVPPVWTKFTYLQVMGFASSLLMIQNVGGGVVAQVVDILIAQPQFDVDTVIAPYIETGATAGTVSTPDTYPGDPKAYLVVETDYTLTPLMRGKFTRIFATIPADQVKYEMRPFSRPSMHGFRSSSYWGVSFDNDATTWLFAVRKAKSLTGAIPADTVARAGTYVGSGAIPRTAKAYTPDALGGGDQVSIVGGSGTYILIASSSDAAIQAAIPGATGLTGVSCTKDATKITVNWVGGTFKTAGLFAGNVSVDSTANSVTITRLQTSDHALSSDAPGNTDTAALTDTASVPPSIRAFTTTAPHGGVVGDHVAFFKGDKIVAMSKAILVSGSSFSCWLADVPGKDFDWDTVVFSSGAAVRYVNGVKDCTIKITYKHYLPDVSPGITTAADIPSTPLYLDPAAWIGALTTPLAYAAIAAQLDPYEGNMQVKRIEEVQMADALEARDVNA